jgi:peptidoglycan/LPS O-acetylase OafA/YrhL
MNFIGAYKRDIIDSRRNFGLDLFRTIAILMVLISHLGINEDYTFGVNLGSLGVEIFFVLSGFLIAQILIKSFTKNLSFESVISFWTGRWFITLPLYYLIIV